MYERNPNRAGRHRTTRPWYAARQHGQQILVTNREDGQYLGHWTCLDELVKFIKEHDHQATGSQGFRIDYEYQPVLRNH